LELSFMNDPFARELEPGSEKPETEANAEPACLIGQTDRPYIAP